mmetsp:Transcript_5303/g.6813  ORF Transcript_5303/g.6813 Transcript_5303/m.6813 type:complete len:217 (-) Transcript_5303:173-823(-)
MRGELRGCRHVRAQLVNLLLTRACLPGVWEAVLHVAQRWLALEGREVHADHGLLAEKALRVPEEVEVASHAFLVRVDDHEVERLELAGTHLLGHALQGRHGWTNMRCDLAASRALCAEARAELDNEGVDLERLHLRVLGQRLGKRERRHAAEAADLEHTARFARGRHRAQEVATLRRGGPIGTHANARQALLVVTRPILILHSLLQLLQRRASLRR